MEILMRSILGSTLTRVKRQEKEQHSPSATASVFSLFPPLLSSSPFKNAFPESTTVASSSNAEGGPKEADPTGRRSVLDTMKLFALLELSETGAEPTFVCGAMVELARLRAMGRAREFELFLLGGRERMG